MLRVTRRVRLTALLSVCLLAAASIASAATINITWLTMSPPAVGSPVPSGSVYFVPGIGNVTVTHSLPASFTQIRNNNPSFTTGSVVNGPDTYQWTNYEYFGTIFTTGALGPVGGTVTYTFSNPLPPRSVYVGTIGLGATSDDGTGASGFSSTTVNQNGFFVGDFVGGPYGASQYTGGVGTFMVKNSVTGPGGQDPWWNTQLGVIRIEDGVNSITVHQSQLRGDGIGVNVGFDIPRATPTGTTTWGRLKSVYR